LRSKPSNSPSLKRARLERLYSRLWASPESARRPVDSDASQWYQRRVCPAGGIRNILNLHELFRGWLVLSGLGYQLAFTAPRVLRNVGALRLAVALGALALLLGCSSYNPNLGVAPTLSSAISFITPSARSAGCSGFGLNVQGNGFTTGSVVQWNGSNRTTTFESATELLATINASDIAKQGAVSVNVAVPGQTQGNGLSNFLPFTISAPSTGTCPAPPAFQPTITGLSSASEAVGTSVTITGTFFGATQGTSTVTFHGTPATPTTWSETSIAAPVPAGATSGSLVVTVGGLPSNGVLFTVTGAQIKTPPTASTTSPASSGAHSSSSISVGPRYVAFVAASADPSTDASTGMEKIFFRDTCARAPADCTPQTILVSAGLDGAEPNGASRSPSISADGRFVAFASDASNLVTDDTNGVTDVFLSDTCKGALTSCTPVTIRVSVGPDDAEANGESASPSISADGRFVAFDSAATNLVLDGLSGPTGAFLRDTCFGAATDCTPSTTRLMISPPPPR
jgi:hypothetical protein